MHQPRQDIQARIDLKLSRYMTCLGMAMNPWLEAGDKHAAPPHFRLMMACAEICRTSAHFALLNSPHHTHTCKKCPPIFAPGIIVGQLQHRKVLHYA